MESEDLMKLGKESYQWEDALSTAFDLKRMTFGTIASSEDEDKALEAYDFLLKQCAESLTSIPLAKVPEQYLKERAEHKSLILKEINRRVHDYDQTRLTFHLEKVISSFFDYGHGPILLFGILKAENPEEVISKAKKDEIDVTYNYVRTYEENRISKIRENLPKFRKGHRRFNVPRKIYGRGRVQTSSPQELAMLVSGLYEFSQPKLQLINVSDEKINSIRLNIESRINNLHNLRGSLGRGLRGRVTNPLITNPKIRELVLGEFRSRNIYDIYAGHSLRLRIDEIVGCDEKSIENIIENAVTPYIKIVGHSRYCGQAVIWDVLGLDELFGEIKIPIVNTYLRVLGYINPQTPEKGYSLIPNYRKLSQSGIYV
jgi:hypothetical protein